MPENSRIARRGATRPHRVWRPGINPGRRGLRQPEPLDRSLVLDRRRCHNSSINRARAPSPSLGGPSSPAASSALPTVPPLAWLPKGAWGLHVQGRSPARVLLCSPQLLRREQARGQGHGVRSPRTGVEGTTLLQGRRGVRGRHSEMMKSADVPPTSNLYPRLRRAFLWEVWPRIMLHACVLPPRP